MFKILVSDKKKKIALILLSLLLLFLAVSCKNNNESKTPKTENNQAVETSTSKAEYVLKLGHVVTDDTPLDIGAKEFKKIVEEKTNGNVEIQIYPNAALGDNRSVVESVQFGVVDFSIPNLADIAGISNTTGVLELPFIMKNQESAEKVFENADIMSKIFGDLEENNIVYLGSFSQGWRYLTTDNVPVRNPNDLKGVKLRTMDSPIHMDYWNAAGANAVPMAFSEVFTALQQGALDAQENPYTNIYTQAYHEVQKYIIETAHIYDVAPLLMSKMSFEKLPEEYQKIILEAGREAARNERMKVMELENGYKQKIVDSGKVEIIELTVEERNAFADVAKSIYGNFSERAKPELIEEILKLQEEL